MYSPNVIYNSTTMNKSINGYPIAHNPSIVQENATQRAYSDSSTMKSKMDDSASSSRTGQVSTSTAYNQVYGDANSKSTSRVPTERMQKQYVDNSAYTNTPILDTRSATNKDGLSGASNTLVSSQRSPIASHSTSHSTTSCIASCNNTSSPTSSYQSRTCEIDDNSASNPSNPLTVSNKTNTNVSRTNGTPNSMPKASTTNNSPNYSEPSHVKNAYMGETTIGSRETKYNPDSSTFSTYASPSIPVQTPVVKNTETSLSPHTSSHVPKSDQTTTETLSRTYDSPNVSSSTTTTNTKPRSTPSPRSPPYSKSAAALHTTQQESQSSSVVPAVVPIINIKNDKRSNESRSRSTLPQPHDSSSSSSSSPPLFPVMVEDEELLDPTRMSVNVGRYNNVRAHNAHNAHIEESSSGSRRATRSAANSHAQQHVDVDGTSQFASNRVTTQVHENTATHPRQDMSSKSNPISRGTSHINANEGKVYSTSYNNTTTMTSKDTSLPSSPPAFPVVVEDEEPISSIPFKKGVDEPRTRYNKPRHPTISKSGPGTVNDTSGNTTLTSATTTSMMASNEGTDRARARGVVPPRLTSTNEPISQHTPSISTSTAAEKNLVINGLSEMKEEAEAGVNRSKKAGKGEPSPLGRDRNDASSPNLPSTTSSTNISKISTSFSTSSSGQPKSPNHIPNRSYPPQINSASIDVNTSAPIAPSSSSSSSSPTVPTAPASASASASASYSVIKTSPPPSASSSTSSSAVSSPHTTGSSSGSSSTSLPASDTSDQAAAESSKSTTAGLDGYVGKNLEGDLNSATKPSVRIAGSKKTENEVPKRLREGSGGDNSLTNPGSKPSINSSSHEVKSDSGSQNTTKNDTQNNKVARQLSSKHDNERKQPDRENKLSSLPSVPPKVSLPSSPKASLPSKNGNTHSSSKSTSSTSKSPSLPIKHTPLPPPPPSLNIYGSRRTGTPLQVIVVGGGIGGLSVAFTLSQSGHSVTILESAKRLGEVGAGLQISPNVSRLLMRWGCGEGISSNSGKPTSGADNYGRVGSESRINERLSSCAVEPEALVFRRYDDGSIVGRSEWGEKVRSEFGAPYLHMHRADLHQILLDNVRASSASSREESDSSTTGAAPRGEGGRVSFRLNSRVQRIDPFPSAERNKVAVELKTGEVYEADLIVGADGVHSLVRETVVGRLDLAQRTGDAAYRAVISTDRILELSYELDARERQEGVQRGEGEDLRRLIDNPEMTTWMGPGRHIMAYCIRAKREYNLVMLYPDDKAEESKYTAEGSVEKMNAEFANFEPRIKHLLSLVEKPLVWRLDEREALHTWVHPAGRVVLLGDACHPMLPYRAQGAAMAIEDAAVIGNLLSRLTGPTGPSQNILSTNSGSQSTNYSGRSQSTPTATPLVYAHLTELLHSYERLRLKRTKRTQEMSRLNRYIFHLPDGPEQDARDSSMRRAMKAEEKEREREREKISNAASQDGTTSGVEEKGKNLANANQWADGAKNKEQYAYDADEVVADWWKREGEDRLRILLQAHGLCDSNGRSERGEDSERGTMRSNGSRSSDGGGGGGGGKKGFWKKVFGASKKDHGSED